MNDFTEKKIWTINGFVALLLYIALMVYTVILFISGIPQANNGNVFIILVAIGMFVIEMVLIGGFFIVGPNESRVFTFFGTYIGTVKNQGYYWTNPLVNKKSVSLRVRNFNSESIKVNDELGNPIEIAAVVVWKVTDSAKAVFNVENYEGFVKIQSETAIRNLASRYAYDSNDKDIPSLRANPDEIAEDLKKHVQDRLASAGITIIESRLSHLAYASEIAQAMLRRQQAAAVIAARRLIVDGAVGMVKMALESLENEGVVKLDEDKKAQMVNNLLVALVSESEAQPIINTGTLYS